MKVNKWNDLTAYIFIKTKKKKFKRELKKNKIFWCVFMICSVTSLEHLNTVGVMLKLSIAIL